MPHAEARLVNPGVVSIGDIMTVNVAFKYVSSIR
jgi:hypothetical protein